MSWVRRKAELVLLFALPLEIEAMAEEHIDIICNPKYGVAEMSSGLRL
jgi:hypothetical protein